MMFLGGLINFYLFMVKYLFLLLISHFILSLFNLIHQEKKEYLNNMSK